MRMDPSTKIPFFLLLQNTSKNRQERLYLQLQRGQMAPSAATSRIIIEGNSDFYPH